MSLSPEREKEIRQFLDGDMMPPATFSYELLAELDRLRAENHPDTCNRRELFIENVELREKLEVAVEALEFVKDYDRSPYPEYGEIVRGHKPGIGQRFITPKEKARISLEALSKIRGENDAEIEKV